MNKERFEVIRKQFSDQFEPILKQHDEISMILELAEIGLNPPKKLEPTHFTIIEGGEWIEWYNRGFSNTKAAHAIKFEGGAIFDMENGWRGSERIMSENELLNNLKDIERRVPRYTDNINVNDVRIVSRGLLEHCLGIFENIKSYGGFLTWDIKDQTDVNFAELQLKAALQTEKPILQASVKNSDLDPYLQTK